jgi:CRP-like cAMP-binding protein
MAVAENEAKRAALRGSQLFRALRPPELDAVLAHAVMRRVSRGTLVLRKGDPATGMVVIMQGSVRISSVSEDGREVMLGILGTGEVLGEISLLDEAERSADVSTIEDSVLLFVERADFLRLLRTNNDLCLRLMAVLCGRLRRANMALEDLALLDLPTRLGRLLLRLGQQFGHPSAAGTRIEIKLSQKDLSTIVGASREKVNRQLRAWEQEGRIAKDQGYLLLTDSPRFATEVAGY